MNSITMEIYDAVSGWKEKALDLGIPSAQIRLMEPAFRALKLNK